VKRPTLPQGMDRLSAFRRQRLPEILNVLASCTPGIWLISSTQKSIVQVTFP
jgi:hypothetical protein